MNAEAARADDTTHTESHHFSAEISKVLQLMIHSLYTNKDIFLRELISNASDACDKLRYEAAQNDALLGEDAELKIRVDLDVKAGTITVSDNGIGMDREDLIANLGTIAKSGTQEFFKNLSGDAAKDTNLIGQFGVGFYSAYMVADRVEVISRKAGGDDGWKWESAGDGEFTLAPLHEPIPRGTHITLHIRKDAKEYLDRYKLRHIIQTYSDHIGFPITIAGGKEETHEEVVNDAGALWTRPKSEITDEQYQEFYRHVAHQPDEPFLTLHNQVEGKLSYTNLLFVPSMKPFDLFHPDRKGRVKLYIKRVFITEESQDLLPAYLRFVRGVIDSEDLPLNISRETLQKNPMMDKIRTSITKKLLGELKKKAKKDPEGYAEFWESFGGCVKEGLCEASEPKELILETCRFHSTATSGDAMTSLEEYKERMVEGQEAIYYITGNDVETLRHSPQIEGFKKYGVEVLLLTDHVDDFWTTTVHQFGETPFRSAMKYGSDLDKLAKEDDAKKDDEKAEDETPDLEGLKAFMKMVLGEQVKEVRSTKKLADSPVCLAVGEGDMDLRMEQFLVEHKQLPGGYARIFEINPEHAIIKGLAARVNAGEMGDAQKDLVHLLFDQANILEGQPIKDPAAYARRVNAVLKGSV